MITALFMALSSKVKRLAAAITVVVVAVLYAYAKGRKDQSNNAAEETLNNYISTRKLIDEADTPNDADAAREWLRERK